MRSVILALSLFVAPLSPASAQAVLGVHLGGPGLSIGLELPVYPELVQVPGQPVYYAPRVDANYFFFEGVYWVFRGDRWFASARYDGPWQLVAPEYVPAFVLQVPVRYYRAPPAYFHAWRGDDAPRWRERWGDDWERRRAGWGPPERREAPRPVAAPVYRRDERGERRGGAVERPHDARDEHGREGSRDDRSRGHGGSDDRGRGHGRDGGHGRDD